MIKKIVAFILSLQLAATPAATIDRTEGNQTVIELCRGNSITMVSVPTEEFNNPPAEGNKISVSTATGSFEWLDGDDWYQFKSYDDTVWWALTTETLGFVPEANKTYTLVYYDNGTTNCTEEFDCECEVYDDIFLTVEAN